MSSPGVQGVPNPVILRVPTPVILRVPTPVILREVAGPWTPRFGEDLDSGSCDSGLRPARRMTNGGGASARRLVLALIAMLALLAACTPPTVESAGAGYTAGDGSYTAWEIADRGEPVDLAGTTFQGDEVDLADWRGDVVVINFWYAGCPPCRAEAPDLAAIYADYPDVHMLGINPRDDAGTAEAFERTFEVPFPSLWDRDAAGVAAMQGVVPLQAMPTTVVLDGEGRVAARILGQVNPTILRGLIDDVAAEA